MRQIAACVFLGVLLITTAGVSADRIHSADFQYRGAFKLPQVVENGEYVNGYGQRGMEFDPSGDPEGEADGYPGSLWVNTHDYNKDYIEVAIPIPSLSGTYASLPAAEMVTSSLSLDMGTCTQSLPYLAGFEITSSYVWTSCARFYNVSYTDYDNLYRWDLNFSNPVQLHAGAEIHPNRTGLWLAEAPEAWARSYTSGKRLLTGNCRNSHGGTLGPTIYALDESNPEGPAVGVLVYRQEPEFPSASKCSNDKACDFPGYTPCDRWRDVEWISTAEGDALVMVGERYSGPTFYVEGTGWNCGDRHHEIIFYAPDELGASAAGSIDPWVTVPYEFWSPPEVFAKSTGFGGAGFDSVHGIFYVIQKSVLNGKSVVHVWTVGSPGRIQAK